MHLPEYAEVRRDVRRDLFRRAYYSVRRTQRFGFVAAIIKQSALALALTVGTQAGAVTTYILWATLIGGYGLCLSAVAHKQWPHILTNATTAGIATLAMFGFGIGGH